MIFYCLSVNSLCREAHNVLSILCEVGFTLRQDYVDVIKILNSEQFFSLNFLHAILAFYTAISSDL